MMMGGPPIGLCSFPAAKELLDSFASKLGLESRAQPGISGEEVENGAQREA
jgi:hypothetical protein